MRFPGFEGEWETKKLSAYLYENKERNRDSEFSKSDVLSVSGDFGIVNQIELLGRSFAGKSVTDYHVVRTGDIVYTKSPLKEYPYGIVKHNNGKEGIVSTLYAVYHHKDNVDGQFVEYYFSNPQRTNRYFKPIVRIGAKHDMKIGNEEVLNNFVVFPSLTEQRKITEMLFFLDERIAIQNKVIEKYESLIKALYKTTFARISADFLPLGSIVSIQKGKQLNGELLNESGLYYVMNGGTSPSGYYGSYNMPGGTISISEGGNSCGYVQFNDVPFWCGGHCYTLLPIDTKNVYYKYLYHYLKFQEEVIMSLRIGSGLPNIQKKDIMSFPVLLPDPDVQIKLCAAFDSIEHKIKIERTVSTILHKQRTYLLKEILI